MHKVNGELFVLFQLSHFWRLEFSPSVPAVGKSKLTLDNTIFGLVHSTALKLATK